MLSSRVLVPVLALVIVGCSGTPREPLEFSGTIVAENGQVLPDEFSLILVEERRDQSAFSTALLPVAEIPVSAEGFFSYEGNTCENVQLLIPYVAEGIGGNRNDPIWRSEIRIELDAEQVENISSDELSKVWRQTREEANEFELLNAHDPQPC